MKQKGKGKKDPSAIPVNSIEGFLNHRTRPVILLAFITFAVYFGSLFLDYTRLDDSIFIVENAQFNKDPGNIAVAFQRGLFNPTKDVYYRPIFLVDFIIESRFFGTSPMGYHFTNLLFHIISVILILYFLRRSGVGGVNSFLLSLLFAVHPVLTQAVAWIPGRNDMLLMIFFLGGFLLLLKYLDDPGPGRLMLQAFLFLVALFTKETAIIIPVIIAGYVLIRNVGDWRKMIWPAVTWTAALGIWYWVRSQATLASGWLSPQSMLQAGFERIGVIIQYIGKIFLPVNLAVFPEYDDISLVWGFIALGILAAIVIYSQSYRKPLTWLGLFWFLVFLIPVLIVPKSLNDQVFEHRLYLPMVGILLILSQSVPFSGKLSALQKTLIIGAVAVVFSAISIYRTSYFKDGITFWTKAVEGSPNSAYAHSLLGTKVEDPVQREFHFRKAYALNPDLKNLKYYLGKVLSEKKETDSAMVLLRREVATNPIPDAFFLMAQISFDRQSFDSAAKYLEKVVELDPLHPQANHNLVLLYYQQGRKDDARLAVKAMQLKGMDVGQDVIDMVNKP